MGPGMTFLKIVVSLMTLAFANHVFATEPLKPNPDLPIFISDSTVRIPILQVAFGPSSRATLNC